MPDPLRYTECEACSDGKSRYSLTLADEDGMVLRLKWVCRGCAEDAGFEVTE